MLLTISSYILNAVKCVCSYGNVDDDDKNYSEIMMMIIILNEYQCV